MIGLMISGLIMAAAPETSAQARFDQLKSLAGEWEGKSGSGRALRISYRPIARDSALIETWTLAPGRETMTVYHMDGAQLMATHYCAMGNQPRLMMDDGKAPRISFSYRDATNLATPDAGHQHSFWIEPAGPDRMTRSETYLEKGASETETIIFSRVAAKPQ